MASDGPRDREALLARVEARVERYGATRDSAEILGADAAREAAALLAVVGDEPDAEAVLAVAWLHWCRADHLDSPDDEAELAVAVPLFIELHAVDPGLVPPLLRAQLDEPEPVSAGTAAYRRWQETGDRRTLDEAVELLRAEAAQADNTPWRLSNLAGVLRERFLIAQDPADIDEAVTAADASVRLTAPGDPEQAVRLSNQGSALLARFDHSGDLTDLDAAVTSLRAATGAADDGVFLSNLAAALFTRHTMRDDPADLAAAVAAADAAVTASGHSDETAADARVVLCLALTRQFETTGDPAVLARAVAAGQQAVRQDGAAAASGLAGALVARYLLTGAVDDLDHTIALGRRAVADSPAADRATHLSSLSNALLLRFAAGADPATVDEAIRLAGEAVAAAGPGHPGRVTYLTNLGSALLTRHESTGRDEDLRAALAACREALAGAPPRHRDRPRATTTAGLALLARYEASGTEADLVQAVHLAREAVAATTAPTDDRIGGLGNLYAVLHRLFVRTGDVRLLDEAIGAVEQAARLAADTASAASALSNLSTAYGLRHEATGAARDLDGAVDTARRAVEATGPADRALSVRYGNLSAALQSRFAHLGDLSDLTGAVEAARRAVTAADGPAALAVSRSGLAAALYRRFTALHEATDLDEAVDAARAAVAATPDQAPEQAGRRVNLAAVLTESADLGNRPEHLDEAVQQYRDAVAATAGSPVLRAIVQSGLCHALTRRHATTGTPGDLRDAITAGRDAVRLGGDRPAPDRAVYLVNLARSLHLDNDLDEALPLLAEAASVPEASAEDRLSAAWERGRIAAEAGLADQARLGYAEATRLLPRAGWSGLGRRSRERHLGRVVAVAADAAAWQLTTGHVVDAVELLELGRSVLWTSMLDQRPDLSRLERADSTLARQLALVSTRLARL